MLVLEAKRNATERLLKRWYVAQVFAMLFLEVSLPVIVP